MINNFVQSSYYLSLNFIKISLQMSLHQSTQLYLKQNVNNMNFFALSALHIKGKFVLYRCMQKFNNNTTINKSILVLSRQYNFISSFTGHEIPRTLLNKIFNSKSKFSLAYCSMSIKIFTEMKFMTFIKN